MENTLETNKSIVQRILNGELDIVDSIFEENTIHKKIYYNERYNKIAVGLVTPKDHIYFEFILLLRINQRGDKVTGLNYYNPYYLNEYHWIELGDL